MKSESIKNRERYLSRLAAPVQEKMKIVWYLKPDTRTILDVGCADGSVTLHLAQLFPKTKVLGIDLNPRFIERATVKAKKNGVTNASFECIYLRDLLARNDRFEAVTFVSVLHEFYSYGEGISSVAKALADAHELLSAQGRLVIRDMIVPQYFKRMHVVEEMLSRIEEVDELKSYFQMFGNRYGPMDNLLSVNHFLLKYLYTDNWDYEMQEHYLAVTLEEYKGMLSLLGMELLHAKTYLIPFLRDKWHTDFGFSERHLDALISTAILAAEKP